MTDHFADTACPMPGCSSALYLTWTRTVPLYAGTLTEDAGLYLEDATTGSWRVECAEGHVVLLPGALDCDEDVRPCSGELDHDHDDELRTFTPSDKRRLVATLQALRGAR